MSALHLDLVPVADSYAGALLFPAEVGADAVRLYRDWAASVGENVTTVVRFIRPPDLPDVPEPLRELPDEAIDVFVSLAGVDSGTPLLLTELRQMGGALGRPAEDGGALSHLEAEFAMLGIGLPMTPELGQAIDAQLDRLYEAMAPWAADGGYFNFAERPCDADAILRPDVCSRLAEVKRLWDPAGQIVGSHSVALDPAS